MIRRAVFTYENYIQISCYVFKSVCREQASSASGKAASGMSSDERNQVSHLYRLCFAVVELYGKTW